ncbi:MAG: C-terminal binding protein [Chloroflexota bacterium]
MAEFLVLYTDRGDYSDDFSIEDRLYGAIGADIVDARLNHNAIDWHAYERHLSQADAVICFRMPVDRRAVQAAPRMKVAVRSGVGYENFDLQAFAERGIPACNVPDYGSEEVAVHALSLILALKRQVVHYDRALRHGQWRGAPGQVAMRRLTKQTAGVIGLGRIGRQFAARARALFGEVLACDPFVAPEAFAAAGVEAVGLEDLLARSDAISIHVPLTRQTRHMIGQRELGLMKPTALLVNTARGAVLDQLALAEGLNAGVLEGAACDVWEHEPTPVDHPLLSCANFIASPHVAGISVEGAIDNRTKQAEEVVRVLSGQPPLNQVFPED